MSINTEPGLPPKEWERFFATAKVKTEQLVACRSARSKAVVIGQFLTPLVGREVPIEVKGRTGTAVLRVADGRCRQKHYHFDVRWDKAPQSGAGENSAALAAVPTKKKKEPEKEVVAAEREQEVAGGGESGSIVENIAPGMGPVDSMPGTMGTPEETPRAGQTGNGESW